MVTNRSVNIFRDYDSAVMYDNGKVLVVGGGDPPTNTAEVIDLNASTPAWRQVASMAFARRQLNTTVLPDGKVLVTGGTSGPGFNNTNTPVFAAEMWDPATETWTTMASQQFPRLYHSGAVLLPDARVLTIGGDNVPQTEIYEPPYLFKGARPTINSAPGTVSYGQTFFVETPNAASITQVTWIRLSSVTHSFNMNQRINRLSFSQVAGGLNVVAPSNANLTPPGHYMLFILNSNGVPSVAKIIRVTSTSGGPALTSLSPNSAPAGGPAFTLTVNGSGFVSGSVVQWNGAARTTTFVNATQLTAAIPASDIGTGETAQVTVVNPAGGGTSNPLTLTISASLSVSPTTIPAGGTVTASWSGIANPSGTDWIGLYTPGAANTAFLAWRYTTGAAGGNVPLTIPSTLAPGAYQLRLLANDGYTLLATSNNFTVGVGGGAGSLQFSSATYTVAENVTGGNATITITRTGGSAGAVGVTFATSNGTATAPSDYTAVSQTVSFANGDTANKTVSIPIVNDTSVEPNETVNLALTTPTGGATLGSPSTAVLTITDNDTAPAGTLQFSSATYSVAENGGNATITITRTGGSAGAVGVTFATSNGTATAPADYTACTQTVSFANGDTANKTVSIPIVNDTSVEPNETVNLALSNPTGGATLGTPSTAVLTITDNDGGTTLSASPTTVAPGGTITATWSGIANPSATDWIGLYTPGAANTAFLAWRYTTGAASGNLPLTIPSTLAQGTYQLRLLANDGYTLLATSNNFTVGVGGGAGTLQFSVATYGVAENGGSATVTITRTGGSAGAVGVSFVTSNGTATAPSDYTAVNQTVTFASGDTANKTVSIPIVNDTLVEPNETINLALTSPTGGATLGSPNTAVLTITDNDGGTTLSASPTTVAPGGTITATWSGIATPTARDWIGLYTPGAANTAFIQWMYVSCSQSPSAARASGSCPFVVPGNVAPGTYQLRLLANDGFTLLLATSNALTVQ